LTISAKIGKTNLNLGDTWILGSPNDIKQCDNWAV